MVGLSQIIKAFVGRPGNTLEDTCTIGGRPLLSSQCTLCGRVLMHPFPSMCIRSAQLTAEPVHPIPALTIVGGLNPCCVGHVATVCVYMCMYICTVCICVLIHVCACCVCLFSREISYCFKYITIHKSLYTIAV